MTATHTENNLPLRVEGFKTTTEALDYAATGRTGYNFYSANGTLTCALPYEKLRARSLDTARRLAGLALPRGARVALVADTHPDFLVFFFGCQYAGLVPVPLPADIRLGNRNAYIQLIHRMLVNCRATVAVAQPPFESFLLAAAEGLDMTFAGSSERFTCLPMASGKLKPSGPGELAYLQYTSGSTRFPRGVMITQTAVMNNLSLIARYGIRVNAEDRAVSWLPFFHDMGLVGLVLAPMASQRSVDYLNPRDFAMRPRLWLGLMTQNHASISFSPPFGYALCAKRLRNKDISRYDLSAWRVAGVGAETIQTEPLENFADTLAPAGFAPNALVACYGMAECSLAVSFSPLGKGIKIDWVDAAHLSTFQQARTVDPHAAHRSTHTRRLVRCGPALPGYEIQVRDAMGQSVPDGQCGILFIRGPSVMSGYFGEPALTRETLSSDGWLDTGDVVYRTEDEIVITGRQKDLIVINGRNIWPQDLEILAEQQPELRTGDTSAFPIQAPSGHDLAVLVVECRESNTARRRELMHRLQGDIRKASGISCFVDLVPRNTLPRTTSGKLSRSGARRIFLKRVADGLSLDPLAEFEPAGTSTAHVH